MTEVSDAPLSTIFPLGAEGRYRRRVTVAELKSFTDLTGDDDPIHWDEAFCRGTPYGRPIAPAILLLGYLSAASVRLTAVTGVPVVSLGYDRVRFITAVFAGEEIDARFTVTGHDETKRRVFGAAELRVGDRLAAVAQHILQRVG